MENPNVELYRNLQKSPLFFIEKMFKLTPQALKPEFEALYPKTGQALFLDDYSTVRPDMFEDFQEGKNVTWQQWIILSMVERSLVDKGKRKISIVSGNGIGKDAVLSMLILWYLLCFKDAQIACTAPNTNLMHDVLWKELKVWLDRMPKPFADLYDWTTSYLRIKQRPETWFARARTARKENPEAMSGIHSRFVFLAADEASAVDDEIFKKSEGSLTGENYLVFLISNGTRNEGFFYDTHHSQKEYWQTASFDSNESPIVKKEFIQGYIDKYGIESDTYRSHVSGGFPSSEQIDEKKYIPLILEHQIIQVSEAVDFIGRKYMGIDPSGEGDDTTVWVIRDSFMAKVVHKEKTSSELSIARITIELFETYELSDFDIFVDNFGVGANISKELALSSKRLVVNSLNWGEHADDEDVYLNKRAEAFFRMRNWILRGGAVVGDVLKKQLGKTKYRNSLNGKKQIMDKPTMRKMMSGSPDEMDALALTFVESGDVPGERGTVTTTTNHNRTGSTIHDAI